MFWRKVVARETIGDRQGGSVPAGVGCVCERVCQTSFRRHIRRSDKCPEQVIQCFVATFWLRLCAVQSSIGEVSGEKRCENCAENDVDTYTPPVLRLQGAEVGHSTNG